MTGVISFLGMIGDQQTARRRQPGLLLTAYSLLLTGLSVEVHVGRKDFDSLRIRCYIAVLTPEGWPSGLRRRS